MIESCFWAWLPSIFPQLVFEIGFQVNIGNNTSALNSKTSRTSHQLLVDVILWIKGFFRHHTWIHKTGHITFIVTSIIDIYWHMLSQIYSTIDTQTIQKTRRKRVPVSNMYDSTVWKFIYLISSSFFFWGEERGESWSQFSNSRTPYIHLKEASNTLTRNRNNWKRKPHTSLGVWIGPASKS